MNSVEIERGADRKYAVVDLPRSKSVAARVLVCRWIDTRQVAAADIPDCDDSRELAAALSQLSQLSQTKGGLEVPRFDLGLGATSFRFFLALVASLEGFEGIVDCGEALRARPIAPLVDALRSAGAVIEYMEEDARPPLMVRGRKLQGGRVKLPSRVSSQFASALLIASRLWEKPLELDEESIPEVSRPYWEMTRRVIGALESGGADYQIEADWSAASYIYEYALLRPGVMIRIPDLRSSEYSVQGDAACAELFGRLGVSTLFHLDGVELMGCQERISEVVARSEREPLCFDMKDLPDLVPALVVGMCMAGIRFRISGVSHLRVKECDRVSVLSAELARAGFVVGTSENEIYWNGGRNSGSNDNGVVVFESHGDHRMAMSFAVAAARLDHVVMEEADAVSKSFAGFYGQLQRLGFSVKRSENSGCVK